MIMSCEKKLKCSPCWYKRLQRQMKNYGQELFQDHTLIYVEKNPSREKKGNMSPFLNFLYGICDNYSK